jgi:hypothetical protein
MRMPNRPRLALLALLIAGAASAAEPAPPPSGIPTPEQIDAVTGTRPMEALEPAPTEQPAQLDAVSVEATRKREIAFRTVELALDRVRSDKSSDADVIVCEKQQRVGSHITKIYCASNRTWNYIRKETSREFLGETNTLAAPYPLYPGPVYELSATALNKIGKQFADGDHAGRLAQLTAEENSLSMTDEWNTPPAVVARFARAFDAVGRAAKQGGDTATTEQRMAAAIAAQGFSVEEYNDLVARLESSGQFQKRVSAATQSFR